MIVKYLTTLLENQGPHPSHARELNRFRGRSDKPVEVGSIPTTRTTFIKIIGKSFKGRTSRSDRDNIGSNPVFPTTSVHDDDRRAEAGLQNLRIDFEYRRRLHLQHLASRICFLSSTSRQRSTERKLGLTLTHASAENSKACNHAGQGNLHERGLVPSQLHLSG